MKRVLVPLIISALAPLSSLPLHAEEAAPEPGDLPQVQIADEGDLSGVCGITMSADGKFVYAAAFHRGVIATFSRDAESGAIKLVDRIEDPSFRVVAIRLSKDGAYAAAAAIGNGELRVFKRDAQTGKLELLASAKQGANGNDGLTWAGDANFSPDNRFIYTASANGVGVYRFEDGGLTFVQAELAGGKLKAVRNTTPSIDGTMIYAPGYQSHSIAALRCNAPDGKVELLQLLTDGEEGCEALGGALRATCSPDGKNVYVSSGRFGGDQGVTAFAQLPDGTLKLVEQYTPENGTLEEFEGGNDIKVSPDGRLVYALACLADRLFRFQRDPNTGALTFIGSQPVGIKSNPGAAGLCFSPDSKFVYIADENSSSIVVLKVP